MKLITQRDLIRNVDKKWHNAYAPNLTSGRSIAAWGHVLGESSAVIYQRLVDLDKETASPEDVNKIIGSDSWTRISCGECGKNVEAVIRCGKEPDYDSQTAYLCRQCSFLITSIWEREST